MNRCLVRSLLSSYPSSWRDEYGPELEDVLRRRPFRMRDVFNVLWSGFSERLRQPLARFFLYSLLGSAFVFLTSVILARPLWNIVSAPVTAVLREHGAKPIFLIQVTPFQGLEVVWLGIPILITAFVTFAWMLILTWMFFSESKDTQKRQWARRFVPCSGILFILSSLSFVAWHRGSVAQLLNLYPDQNAPLLSVGHCYILFALSTIGPTLLLQIPVMTFFGWRFRVLRKRNAP
jgi:Sec-independent protein secretion pathway component TatC